LSLSLFPASGSALDSSISTTSGAPKEVDEELKTISIVKLQMKVGTLGINHIKI
jgi:hypothetical protein